MENAVGLWARSRPIDSSPASAYCWISVSFSSSVQGGERRKMRPSAAFVCQQDGPSLGDRSLIAPPDRMPHVVLDKVRTSIYVLVNMKAMLLHIWARISRKLTGRLQQMELNLWTRHPRR